MKRFIDNKKLFGINEHKTVENFYYIHEKECKEYAKMVLSYVRKDRDGDPVSRQTYIARVQEMIDNFTYSVVDYAFTTNDYYFLTVRDEDIEENIEGYFLLQYFQDKKIKYLKESDIKKLVLYTILLNPELIAYEEPRFYADQSGTNGAFYHKSDKNIPDGWVETDKEKFIDNYVDFE